MGAMGSGGNGPKESMVEKAVRMQIEESDKRDKKEVVTVIDLLKGDDKRKEKIEKIITEKVAEFNEDNETDEVKKKSEEQLVKDFYNKVTNYDDKQLPSEYDQALSQLTQMYGRRTLVNILVHKDLLPSLLPSLLKDKRA
jgi:hypothetical protein